MNTLVAAATALTWGGGIIRWKRPGKESLMKSDKQKAGVKLLMAQVFQGSTGASNASIG